ncbi:MAG: sugar ABC transporter permease [Erysipelothrix sp.]|nr:sugar ABC transporter permease [Erysipelothrix sp.]
MKHSKKAGILSVIPGLGQLYNKQIIKGILFMMIALSYVLLFASFISVGLWGIVTLGTTLPRDNSIFLLARGVLSLIILAIGALLFIGNIVDAYKNGAKRDEGHQLYTIRQDLKNLVSQGYPYLISGPSLIMLIFTVVFPILFSFALAFTNYNLYNSPPAKLVSWVGLETFKNIFTVDIWRSTFIDVLGWTVVWTLCATILQVSLGIFLAVVVHQKDVKFKKLIRTILILPWAVPGFVTILIFAGMFNDTFGVINTTILPMLGLSAKPWMTNHNYTRVALVLIQGWLAFPYIFIVTTGVLQSIPEDLYEAAVIDGASAFRKFKDITLPLILMSIAPILITQFTFNFNNFNIIYLFNGGGPAVPGSSAGGTDILVSWIYKLTMQSSQYSLAAALTILLSVFVIGIALWQFKKTSSFKEAKK